MNLTAQYEATKQALRRAPKQSVRAAVKQRELVIIMQKLIKQQSKGRKK